MTRNDTFMDAMIRYDEETAMELRVLQYFLSVAREESITGAAKALNVSQPALSRQLKELEEELEAQLFIRGSRKIELTEEGMLLRKRAEEILSLAEKAKSEVSSSGKTVSGDITIGSGETINVHFLTQAVKRLQMVHPEIHLHIISGDSREVTELLDNGLIDFGLIFDPLDMVKYNTLRFPREETWGLLMRRDDPLAAQNTVSKRDLLHNPLIVSRHFDESEYIREWMGDDLADIKIVGTYSLLYNGSLMVEDGMGYALCIDHIIDTGADSTFCFRPIYPEIKIGMSLAWKKYQVLTKPAELFLKELQKRI